MRAAAYVCCVAFCAALAGCGTLGKKWPFKPKEPPRPSAGTGWPPPSDGPGAPSAEHAPPPALGGLLAGRVLDSYDRPPPPTYIQVVSAQDARDAKNPPLEVATDRHGFFTIQGLKPGQHYQLIARTRDGDPKLAGTTWATPPNPRILIFISQDFATPNTPAAPPPPAIPGRKPGPPAAPPPSWPQQPADANAGTQGRPAGEAHHDPAKPSSASGPAPGGADIGPPMKLNDPAGAPGAPPSAVPPQPRTDIRTQDIVDGPEGRVRVPPVTNIPPQARTGGPARADPATRVPSCVLTGKQLHNFALHDLDARPWEYRQHQGRVVLLVFWETGCLPCRAAIPHLKIFQDRYGPSGLEIVGIAYEDGPLQEQIRKVQGVRDRLGIPYRLLLGSDVASCPVRTQFGVNAFPTLVLLDEKSRIIWRQPGFDAYKLQELEMLIKRQLRVR